MAHIKEDEIMENSDKWMEVSKIILSEATEPPKTNTVCFLLYVHISFYTFNIQTTIQKNPQRVGT